MLILVEALAFIPFGVLLAYNIIYPEGPESHILFRVMTVVYYAAIILLFPALSLLFFKDDEIQPFGCSWFVSIVCLISLLLSAHGRIFFGTFSLISHTNARTHDFVFYSLFLFSWSLLAVTGIMMLTDRDDWGKHIEKITVRSAEDSSSENFLRGLAENDESKEARKTAFERLRGQENFEHVLIFGKYPDTRIRAVEKITDQEILKRSAEKDEDQNVRKAAVEMLNDDAVLARILQNDPSALVRESAAAKINDEKALRDAARIDKSAGVRRTSMRRITDPNFLAIIAEKDPDESIRREAFEKVGDPEILNRMIANDPDFSIWPSAVRLITDQTLLEKIARNRNNHWEVRREAVKLVENKDVLAQLAIEDKDDGVRRNAGMKTDTDAIVKAILDSDAPEIFSPKSQIPKIKDIEALKKIAIKDHYAEARAAAVSEIPIPSFLACIALSDKDGSVRKAAVQGISDPVVLRHIIQNDDSMNVVQAAVMRTPDEDSKICGWERILKKDSENMIAADALRDLYRKNNVAKLIWDDHQHTDYDENGTEYCCYADHQDESPTYYRIEQDKNI